MLNKPNIIVRRAEKKRNKTGRKSRIQFDAVHTCPAQPTLRLRRHRLTFSQAMDADVEEWCSKALGASPHNAPPCALAINNISFYYRKNYLNFFNNIIFRVTLFKFIHVHMRKALHMLFVIFFGVFSSSSYFSLLVAVALTGAAGTLYRTNPHYEI